MKTYSKILYPAITALSLAAAVAALADTLTVLTVANGSVNPLKYQVMRFDIFSWHYIIAGFTGIAALIIALRNCKTAESERIFRPALLLWFIPGDSFPGILLAIAVIGFVVFQIAGYWKKPLPELPQKYGTLIAIAGGAAAAVWGYYLQSRAFDSLYFIWGDWNQYVEHYQYLLSGKAIFVQWCAGAGHWNFGVNLIMSAALKIWYAPDTVFIINALCIASVVPLGYWLSRKCNLSTWMSVVLLVLTVFNPVLSNQYLSFIYGFHPIVFFVPLLLGFFITREYKCRWAMAVLFVLSLLVQETVCVFWAGYAIYLLCCKRWKSGIALFAAMVGSFFFFSKVVIPAAHSAAEYSQMFHYAQLGSSMGEVLLSPLTRPGAFWGTLFERSSICFALAVFVPFLCGIVFKPLMMVTVLPIFAGVVLQGSPEVKSVMLQYGLECTVFCLIVMLINLKTVYPELRRPAVCSVLITTLSCGWLLGMIPGGRGPLKKILNRPSGIAMVDFLDRAAGDAGRMIATGRIRGQFQFSRESVSLKNSYRPGDVIILDLHDNGVENGGDVAAFRRKLAADRRVVPVTYVIWENHTIVMFKVLPQEVVLPPIPWLRQQPETEFDKFGTLIDIPVKYCKLRALYHNGQMIYRAMLMENSSLDIEFALNHKFADGSTKAVAVRFGNGLFPAYSAKPGTVFEFTVPCPPPQSIGGNIYKISES